MSWLKQHQTRMAAMRAVDVPVPDPNVVEFTLSAPTKTLNQILRMHWRDRQHYQQQLSGEIGRLTMAQPVRIPFEKCRVTITRYSLKVPDADNLWASAKPLVDCLLVHSATHPQGLGFCRDDSPDHMQMIVKSALVKRSAEQRTHVLIERIA